MSLQLTKNIWAVGRNYAAHAAEMNAPVPKTPMIFLKSGSCLNPNSIIHLPAWSSEIHHELEIAFLLDERLEFSHISLALDLTARDAQEAAKKSGQPWTLAKSFTGSCPVGSWLSILDIPDLAALEFKLYKNKTLTQHGKAQSMVFKPEQLLQFVKTHFPVTSHDMILTGTPEGVGPLKSGDLITAELLFETQILLACHWDVI